MSTPHPLYGTLNLLLLKTIGDEPKHGLGVLRAIRGATGDLLKIEEGALYPALHRLEKDGLVEATWGLSENRRRAKFYSLTDRGREALERESRSWLEHALAVGRVLGVDWVATVAWQLRRSFAVDEQQRLRQDVEEELRFHIEGVAQELIEEGWVPSEAEAEARRRFGDVGQVTRTCLSLGHRRLRKRERRRVLEVLVHDLKLAFRSLSRRRAFSLALVSTLGLALGATTAIFSLLSATLLSPLPFADPEELLVIYETDRDTGTTEEAASLPDVLDFRERARSFESVEGFAVVEANLATSDGVAGGAEAERATVAIATAGLDDLFGLSAERGRLFEPRDARPEEASTAVVSSAILRRHFGPEGEGIGQQITLDDETYEVIGVLPELEFPEADVWVPLRPDEEIYPRYRHNIFAFGRLAEGASVASAQAEMDAIAADLEQEYPQANTARGVYLKPLEEVLRGDVRSGLLLLFLAVLALLGIACANVANLLLARGAGRRRELAVSAALGARSLDLARRFLAEGLLQVGLALVFGLMVAYGLLRLLMPLLPEGVALSAVDLDWRTFLFSAALGGLVVAFFTLLPTLQARSFDLQTSLRSGVRDASSSKIWFRRAMVVAQVALALVLLAGAAMLLGSLHQLSRVDPGFVADDVLRVDFLLPESRYPRDFSEYPHWTEVLRFNRELQTAVEALPGVASVSLTIDHPLSAGFTNSFVIVGREEEQGLGELKTRLVSNNYLETNGVRVLEGRGFGAGDTTEAPPVLLLNRVAAERLFPDGNVLGQRIGFWGIVREIVGVVDNERMHGIDEPAPPAMYASLDQTPQTGSVTLMVRSDGVEPLSLAPSIRAIVDRLDPGIALFNVTTMEETLVRSQSSRRFISLLLLLFAGASLLLASLGVHAVLAYLVADRRREIGVRMALGAERDRVLRAVLGEGLAMAACGVGLGILAGSVLARILGAFLGSILFEVSPLDPRLYALAAAVLLASAIAACLFPALKATRIDPMTTLRTE